MHIFKLEGTNSNKSKNPGNGIQCMDSNGTLSALPGQQVEASFKLRFWEQHFFQICFVVLETDKVFLKKIKS